MHRIRILEKRKLGMTEKQWKEYRISRVKSYKDEVEFKLGTGGISKV